MVNSIEQEKRKTNDFWRDTSKLAAKAEDLAHEPGDLYSSHIAACKTSRFINQLYQLVCETGKNWRSIPEAQKRDQIISSFNSAVKDRERARQEQNDHEQKLAAKDRLIRNYEEEISRFRGEADSSRRKYKEDLAKVETKLEAEHRKRLEQEQQIEDNWSRKLQKRNGKITDMEKEIQALKQKVEGLSHSPVQTTAIPKTSGESATLAAAEKKNAIMKEQIRNCGKKYKALLDERGGLATKLKERECEVDNQQKLILSLRSSEHSVQDRIEKAIHQVSALKDAEIASVQACLAEQLARNEALEEELKELRRQRQVHGTMIQGLNRRLQENQGKYSD